MASSCKKGYYFCNSSQKCKRIPRGHKVQSDGELVREYVSDWRSDLDEKYAVNFKVDGSGYNVDAKIGNATVFSKSKKTITKGTTPKHALDKALIGFNNEIDPARNLPGMKNEELQGGVSVEPYTKDTKFLEVETVDIIKPKALNASDWRSELVQIDEKYKYLRGGNPKNLAAPKNKDIKHGVTGIDYTLMVKNDKKKETVSASYEAALNDLVVEILKYDIEDLHNNGFSYEEIAEYYDVKDEVLSEAPAPLVGAGIKILKAVAPKVTKFIANRSVKDSKKVVNWVRSGGVGKLNKNIDKVTLPVGRALKQLPARTYAAGQNFRKAVDATYNAGKALRGSTTNALSSARKNLLPAAKGGLKNVTDAGTRFSNFVDKAYSALEKGTKKLGQRIGDKARQDTAIRNLDKAKINKTKEVFAKVKKLEKKGDVAGDVIDVTNTTKGTGYKRPGDPWNWFPKKPQKQRGIPNPPVDRTNKSLNPAGGALSAIKDKGSALVAKVRNFFSKKGTKQLTGTKTPNKLSGTTVAGALPSGSSKGTKQPYSSKRELAKGWMAYNKAAKNTVNADKAAALARTSAAGLAGLTAGGKVGQEIAKWSDSKAKGYVVDIPGYDPSDKQSPETIRQINTATYKQMQKDKEKGPSQGDPITINGKKGAITHSSVYGKETPKKETPKTTKPKGKTKWVGVNSTWTDRHGNVIAPRMKKTTKSKKVILTPLEQELED